MGKITVKFGTPLNLFLKLEKFEMDVDGPIKILDLERKLLERFPQLKDRTANMKYVYYVLDNKTVRDRETIVAEGQEIMLYQPTLGG
jgi:molybdopterin converting factor small subunit